MAKKKRTSSAKKKNPIREEQSSQPVVKTEDKAEPEVKAVVSTPTLKAPFFLRYSYPGKAKEHYVIYLPLILVLGYIPLLMRTVTYDSYLTQFDWFPDSQAQMVDIFLLIKANVLRWVGLLLLIIAIVWLFTNRKRYAAVEKWMALLGAAALMAIISAIATPYHNLVARGSFENFETIFVILTYYMIFLFTYILYTSTDNIYRDFLWMLRLMSPGYLVLLTIGFLQAIGHDPFQTDIGKTIFATEEYWDNLDLITISGGEYITLHNIDYVPVFLGMFIPVWAVLFTMAKTTMQKLSRGFFLVLTVFDFLAVDAIGGKLALFGALVLVLLLVLWQNRKVFLIGCGVIVAGVVVLFAVPAIREKGLNAIGFVHTDGRAALRFTELATYEDHMDFTLDGVNYTLSYDYDSDNHLDVTMVNEDGETPDYTYNPSDNTYFQYYEYQLPKGDSLIVSETLGDEEEHAILIGTTDSQGFLVSKEVKGGDQYYYRNFVGKYITMPQEFSIANVFPQPLFSGRGEIWNKTLPILKNHMLIGAGSGLFITSFPQWDYMEKAFISSNYDVKPHNLYLQIWVEQGFINLVCFLVIMGIYLWRSLRLYSRANLKDPLHRLGIALLLTVLTYLIGGLVNDSMVVYSPIFWCFFGVGCAVNYRLRESYV